jgi:hypothetical protein
MPKAAAHEWYRPRLAALVAEGEAAGIARDVAVAVITDLINGQLFNPGPAGGDEAWNQDIGEPAYMVNPDGTRPEGGPSGGGADPLTYFGPGGAGGRNYAA